MEKTSKKKTVKQPVKVVQIQAEYRFTDAEIGTLARQAGQTKDEIQAYEDQLSSIKTDYKSKIESAELKMNSLFARIKDGFEMRPCEAVVEFEPKKGRKKFYRHDEDAKDGKGEFIREEDMTASDFQPDLVEVPAKDFTNPVLPNPTASAILDDLRETADEVSKQETDAALDSLKGGDK